MKKTNRIISAILAAIAVLSICTACNSDEAVKRVKRNGVLNVGYSSCNSSNDSPFVMDGRGITTEPAEQIADSMNVEAKFTRLSTDEAYDRLLDGTVDCLWNVASPEKQYVSSVRTIETGIYYRQVIMTTSDSSITRLADVSGKTLAVVSGSDAQTALHEASVMESSLSEIKIFSTMYEVLEALTSGEADCAAVDEPQAMYHTIETSDKFKFIDTPIAENSLVIATRAEDADLCGKISEKYIKIAQNGEIKSLCRQYTGGDMLSVSMQNISSEI